MAARCRDFRVFWALLVACGVLDFLWRLLASFGMRHLSALVAAASVLLPLAALYCLAFALAPRLVRGATVVGLCALSSFSLLACWIVQAREQARQQQCLDNLRQLGMAVHEQSGFQIDVGRRTALDEFHSDSSLFETGSARWPTFAAPPDQAPGKDHAFPNQARPAADYLQPR